jgi:hypothetical protein
MDVPRHTGLFGGQGVKMNEAGQPSMQMVNGGRKRPQMVFDNYNYRREVVIDKDEESSTN